MSEKKRERKTSLIGRIALLAVLGGFVGLYLLLHYVRHGFPQMEAGVYVGSATGLGASLEERIPMYLEVRDDGFRLLVLDTGWSPQLLQREEKLYGAGGSAVAVQPLVVEQGTTKYSLTGSREGGSFAGEIRDESGVRGKWELHRASTAIARDGVATPVPREFRIRHWLAAKQRHEELKLELADIEHMLNRQGERQGELENVLSREAELRERAERRRESLVQEVQQAFAEREQAALQVIELARRIDMMERITQRGQLVRTARRISEREQRWLSAKWDDGSGLAAVAGEGEDVDIEALERAAKRSREVRQLRAQISRERRRVAELDAEYRRRIDSARSGADGRAPRQKKDFWGRVFGG